MEEAAALLRDIADGRPIHASRARGLADAVLGRDELTAAAVKLREAGDEHVLRRCIELAALICQQTARGTADEHEGS